MMHEFFEERKPLKVFISGQKFFGAEILRLCLKKGLDVVGVCCPLDDIYIGRIAKINNIPIISAGLLNHSTIPKDFDLGITAHSFDYIGQKTRYVPKLGWIGYHPSLLPRHRGRSSIEWALKFKDFLTGGTIFWLNGGIDRGDIERQEIYWIDPKYLIMDPKEAAKRIWRNDLLPLGVKLFDGAISDIERGNIRKQPQDKRFSTFEPNADAKDVFKPDLLMLKSPN